MEALAYARNDVVACRDGKVQSAERVCTVYDTACNASDNRYTLRKPCMETNLQKTFLCITQFGGTDA